MKQPNDLSPSKATAIKVVFETFKILKEEGGHLPGREVIEKIRERVSFSEWEKEIYEKTGYVRWESLLHFYTVDCAKAGFLRKAKGLVFNPRRRGINEQRGSLPAGICIICI